MRSSAGMLSWVQENGFGEGMERLSVKELRKSFFSGKKEKYVQAVDNVSFCLNQGEFLGIVGESGSGKSTLLKCLNHIYKPVAGCVLADGKDVGRMTPKERASFIGYVPQNTELCPGLTVWETILSGKGSGFKGKPSSKDLTEVEKILKDLALERYAFTDVCSLSGGERQRVLIGRALAQDPKIILLDEPTSNLDLRYQLEVMEILRSISSEKKMTVAVVIHDLNMALQLADYMIILNKNKIVAKGIPDQILTKQLIQDVYKVDASIIEVSRRKVVIPEKLCCNC